MPFGTKAVWGGVSKTGAHHALDTSRGQSEGNLTETSQSRQNRRTPSHFTDQKTESQGTLSNWPQDYSNIRKLSVGPRGGSKLVFSELPRLSPDLCTVPQRGWCGVAPALHVLGTSDILQCQQLDADCSPTQCKSRVISAVSYPWA